MPNPLSPEEIRKQPAPQWQDMDAVIEHCTAGVARYGIDMPEIRDWQWPTA